jgi:hypothetical protein
MVRMRKLVISCLISLAAAVSLMVDNPAMGEEVPASGICHQAFYKCIAIGEDGKKEITLYEGSVVTLDPDSCNERLGYAQYECFTITNNWPGGDFQLEPCTVCNW